MLFLSIFYKIREKIKSENIRNLIAILSNRYIWSPFSGSIPSLHDSKNQKLHIELKRHSILGMSEDTVSPMYSFDKLSQVVIPQGSICKGDHPKADEVYYTDGSKEFMKKEVDSSSQSVWTNTPQYFRPNL